MAQASPPMLRLLLTEDSPADAEMELRELKRAGLRITHRVADTEQGFVSALREFSPDVILSDFSMPGFDGMAALALARDLAPDTPFVFVSGTLGEEYAIRALRNGATDYVLKTNLVRLPAAVERAFTESKERRERRRLTRIRGRLFRPGRGEPAGRARGERVLRARAHAQAGPDHLPGALRSAHRPAQPHAVSRAPDAVAAVGGPQQCLARARADRPRALQGDQRHARAAGRRRRPAGGGAAAGERRGRHQPPGAPGKQPVRRDAPADRRRPGPARDVQPGAGADRADPRGRPAGDRRSDRDVPELAGAGS